VGAKHRRRAPDGLTRNASTYYDSNEIELKLSFKEAYSGNLHLYAVDWDSIARRETISVNGQTLSLSSSFNQGAWLSFPISVPAGGTVAITVNHTASANAVLSGIFLGEGGSPPAATVASAPQGTWVGKVGSEGYDLAGWDGPTGDVSYIPNVVGTASVSLVQGSRYQWAQNTTDARALSEPGQLTRNASTYYDPNQIQVNMHFTWAYSGIMHLYAVDFDHGGRREIVTVDGQSAVLSELGEGAWVSFPVSVAAGGTVTITVDRTAGPNAVLSGIFLGEAGAPPGPYTSSTRQGSWTSGEVGHDGYLLAGWDGPAGDVSYLPHASVALLQGSRYQWAANTTDPRALTDPGGLIRNAGTYYDPNQIRLQLSFPAAYSGNLELYAVDWDHGGRREIMTVNGQSAVLGEFSEGKWATFAIDVAAGGTVTITVDRTAGSNAVLSGVFMNTVPGAPANPTVSSAPQGSWVGSYGSAGYDLAGWNGERDLVSTPSASVTLAQGSRYVWAPSTEDPRALQSPEKTTREASTYYDPNEIQLKLSFASAYTGALRLYAVDWDSTARRELISVDGQTAELSSEFNQGAWVSFPISVTAGETVTIVVDRTAGANAVLSGIFLN